MTEPDSAPALTLRGLEILEFRSWYELFIGGYGRTLHELPTVMRDATAYAGRDGAMVGVGSCGMSRSVDVPLVRQLVEHVAEPDPTLIDLGCGDGTLLLDLCDDGRRGIGIDPVEASVAAAQARAAAVGRADDVRFAVGTAEDYISPKTAPCHASSPHSRSKKHLSSGDVTQSQAWWRDWSVTRVPIWPSSRSTTAPPTPS